MKVVHGKKYVHRDAVAELSGAEQILVWEALQVSGVKDWDVARVSPDGAVMFGRTTSWKRANPELLESWLVRGQEVTYRSYRAGKRPRYHKTALMLPNPGIGEGGTAMARVAPSAPTRFLYEQQLIRGPVLDFGSGGGNDAQWLRRKGLSVTEYDPNFVGVDRLPDGKFATVLAIYVLNVLPKSHEAKLLKRIGSRVRPDGSAFVAVRKDVTRAGETSRGYQRPVRLKADELVGAPSHVAIGRDRGASQLGPLREVERRCPPGCCPRSLAGPQASTPARWASAVLGEVARRRPARPGVESRLRLASDVLAH